MTDETIPRRKFLVGAGLACTAVATGLSGEAQAQTPVVSTPAVEEGKADFGNVSSKAFFARLLTLTREGFFADPIYGGNRNMASWRILQYPGLPATFANLIDEYRDKRYVAEPRSIADFS